jgi:hypothetical protein
VSTSSGAAEFLEQMPCRKLRENEDHLPSSSGKTGQNALGVGRRMTGVLGGGIRFGRRRRMLFGAFAASSCGLDDRSRVARGRVLEERAAPMGVPMR